MEFGSAELCILLALLIVLFGPARLVGIGRAIRSFWRGVRARRNPPRPVE